MPRYNTTFEVTVADLELIETALLKQKAELAAKTLDGADDGEDTLRDIAGLLGRLHNQKVFYRPKSGVYVGG